MDNLTSPVPLPLLRHRAHCTSEIIEGLKQKRRTIQNMSCYTTIVSLPRLRCTKFRLKPSSRPAASLNSIVGDCQVKNQPKMLKAGLLEPVVTETRNALDHKSKNDHETIRYCLLVIANLSVSRENHSVIMSQCLDTLAGFSKHQDIKARQHAVFALGNICANPDNLEAVVLSGALKTLITYSFPSTDTSVNVQFQAIAALRGISTHQTLRMQVVREGGLEPLVLAAKSDSVEVQRETAATLANLALAEENKVVWGCNGWGGGGRDNYVFIRCKTDTATSILTTLRMCGKARACKTISHMLILYHHIDEVINPVYVTHNPMGRNLRTIGRV